MKLDVEKKLHAFCGAAAIGLGMLMVPVSSYAAKASCSSIGQLAYTMAEVRDGGARWEDVFAAFKGQRDAGQMTQSDFEFVAVFLKFVYTGGAELSPAQVRRSAAELCKKYQ